MMLEKQTCSELKDKIESLEEHITDMKKKMDELREKEERANTLLENANDVFVYIGTDGTVIDVNHRVNDVFEFTREEVIGKIFTDLGIVREEDEKNLYRHFKEIVSGKPVKMLELKTYRKDRSIVIAECSSSPIIKNGKIQGILAIIRDITERKQTEEELQASKEKSRTIFEAANDLIVYMGKDGTILETNERIEVIFGYKPHEVIGKKYTDFQFFDENNMRKTQDFFRDKISGKPVQILEVEVFRKNKIKVYIELTCRLITKNGDVKGFFNVVRDITERKRAEESLRMHRDHLEELVEKRTANLEEANTALKVLLKKREEDKVELEEKMLFNVKELILPYLEKLKKCNLEDKTVTYATIIETNLNDITSPFVRKLSSKYLNFTAGEIKVANLIKHGNSTKEIAEMLNLSHRTIDYHRANIRKKIGIKKLKANLRSYLLSLH